MSGLICLWRDLAKHLQLACRDRDAARYYQLVAPSHKSAKEKDARSCSTTHGIRTASVSTGCGKCICNLFDKYLRLLEADTYLRLLGGRSIPEESQNLSYLRFMPVNQVESPSGWRIRRGSITLGILPTNGMRNAPVITNALFSYRTAVVMR